MMASLYQSSIAARGLVCMSGRMFIAGRLGNTPEQQCRIVIRVDRQTNAAPLQPMPLSRHQVLQAQDRPLSAERSDSEIAEMQPEFAAPAADRDGDRDGLVKTGRLLDKADDLVVI